MARDSTPGEVRAIDDAAVAAEREGAGAAADPKTAEPLAAPALVSAKKLVRKPRGQPRSAKHESHRAPQHAKEASPQRKRDQEPELLSGIEDGPDLAVPEQSRNETQAAFSSEPFGNEPSGSPPPQTSEGSPQRLPLPREGAGAAADPKTAEPLAAPALVSGTKPVRKPRGQPRSAKRESHRAQQRAKEASPQRKRDQEPELLSGIEDGPDLSVPEQSRNETQAAFFGARFGNEPSGGSPPQTSEGSPQRPPLPREGEIGSPAETNVEEKPISAELSASEKSPDEIATSPRNFTERSGPALQVQPASNRDETDEGSEFRAPSFPDETGAKEPSSDGEIRGDRPVSSPESEAFFLSDRGEAAVIVRHDAPIPERQRIEEREYVGGHASSFATRAWASLKLQLALIVVAPILVGAVFSYVAALLSPNVYAARSEIVLNISSLDWNAAERFLATQIVLVKARPTLAPVAEATRIPLRDLEKGIDVGMIGSSDVMRIQYANQDPATALEVVEAVTAQYLVDLRDLEQVGNGRHRILLPATLLEEPVSLRPLNAAIIGAFVGLVIAVAGLILRTQVWPIK